MYGGRFAFQNRLNQLVVGRRFTIFCFVLLCIRGQIPITSPRGAYIRRGDLTEGFLRYDFGGFIFGGAYTWTGLFSEFYATLFVKTTDFQLVFNYKQMHTVTNIWRAWYNGLSTMMATSIIIQLFSF